MKLAYLHLWPELYAGLTNWKSYFDSNNTFPYIKRFPKSGTYFAIIKVVTTLAVQLRISAMLFTDHFLMNLFISL